MNKDNLCFSIVEDDIEESTANLNINEFLENFEKTNISSLESSSSHQSQEDYIFAQKNAYEMNNTAKQLTIICEYYGIKVPKLKKSDIIDVILAYETNLENYETVLRRQQLWHYMDELKSDKFMKKYVCFF